LPLRHVLLAIAAAFICGVAFVAIKLAVLEISPLQVTGWRFLLNAIPLIFFIKAPKVAFYWPVAFGLVQGLLMSGLIFTAVSWGCRRADVAGGAVANVFTIGFAASLLRERPPTMLGASVVFIGLAINLFGAKLFPSGKTAIKAHP
jgi:O-acetylserine/cysteine efflux transporter